MRVLTLLLAVAAIAVGLSLPVDRLTREGVACDYVNAYDLSGDIPDGAYITITGPAAGQCDPPSCGGTLSNCYDVTVDSQCVPFGGGGTRQVAGNNLSGHYHVTRGQDNCLVLCTCSG